jgi:SAM-dependent methyltransferase
MSFKLYLHAALSPIEWSQAVWRFDADTPECQDELAYDAIVQHLPREGLIVDAGCGIAKWPIHLRRRGYRCVGVEISRQAVHIARERDGAVPLVVADTRQMPLKTAAADAVLSFGVIEHDEAGPIASLIELRRILKPGKLLVVAVPFNNLLRRLIVNHLQRYVAWKRRRASVRLGFAEYRFTKRELRSFLRQSGFEPIAAYPNDMHPPRVVGLWVDYENLLEPTHAGTDPKRLFTLPGWKGRAARALIRFVPWAVCGEVVFIARAV